MLFFDARLLIHSSFGQDMRPGKIWQRSWPLEFNDTPASKTNGKTLNYVNHQEFLLMCRAVLCPTALVHGARAALVHGAIYI